MTVNLYTRARGQSPEGKAKGGLCIHCHESHVVDLHYIACWDINVM